MAIEMTCACGRKATVADDHAGKKARCPACGRVQTVPLANVSEPDDDELIASLKRAAPHPQPAPAPLMPPPARLAPAPVALDWWTGEPVPPPDPSIQKVYLVDAKMPFVSMVVLAIKWAFASIPAIFLAGLFWGVVYVVANQVLAEIARKR